MLLFRLKGEREGVDSNGEGVGQGQKVTQRHASPLDPSSLIWHVDNLSLTLSLSLSFFDFGMVDAFLATLRHRCTVHCFSDRIGLGSEVKQTYACTVRSLPRRAFLFAQRRSEVFAGLYVAQTTRRGWSTQDGSGRSLVISAWRTRTQPFCVPRLSVDHGSALRYARDVM